MPIALPGRTVIESGSVVMGSQDDRATITIGDLTYEFVWEPGDTQKAVAEESPGGIRVRLVGGDIGGSATTYTVGDAGTFMGRKLGFGLYWDSVSGSAGITRLFAYSFWTYDG